MAKPDWAIAERTLPDGRLLHVVKQLFNYKLTISSPEAFAMGLMDDAY